jgi:hypothetical protein
MFVNASPQMESKYHYVMGATIQRAIENINPW